MNFGYILSRAWNLIWKNKALLLLGMLAVLSGAGGGGGGSQVYSVGSRDLNFQEPSRLNFQFLRSWQDLGLPTWGIIIVLFLLLVVLALWAVGTIARGGLISGAAAADQEGEVLFSQSFQEGLGKGWRLIGIGVIPALPAVLLLISALISAGIYFQSIEITVQGRGMNVPNTPLVSALIALTCVLIALSLALSLLRAFANRACMLENLDVLGSYRRGLEVLGGNLGPALVLYLVQVALSLVLGLALLLPLALSALCCFLWPLLWFVQGGFEAFYSTLWTLAWRQWTQG